MNISIYIYTQDNHYAEIKTKEVLNKLQICCEYTFSTEPYWKFSDMFVSSVEIKRNILPEDEQLQLIADKWEKYSNNILTSDTIVDNTIKVSDITMVNIWLFD